MVYAVSYRSYDIHITTKFFEKLVVVTVICTVDADQRLAPATHRSATFAISLHGFIAPAAFSHSTVAMFSRNVTSRTCNSISGLMRSRASVCMKSYWLISWKVCRRCDTGKIENVAPNCQLSTSHWRLGWMHSGHRVQQINTKFIAVVEFYAGRFLWFDITAQPRCIVLMRRTYFFGFVGMRTTLATFPFSVVVSKNSVSWMFKLAFPIGISRR